MGRTGEYQGGFYAIITFVGVYVRYFFLKMIKKNKNIEYLSGEGKNHKIDKKQRFYSLIVGFGFILFLFSTVVCFFVFLDTR